MRVNKETQCNIRGGFPVDKDDLFHYITISLLVVLIAISLGQTRLEDQLQTLLTPTLELAKSAIEDLETKVKTFEIDSSKALSRFDETTNEIRLIKVKFEQTQNDFQDAASKTKEEFRQTTSNLQEQTESTLDLFKSKATESTDKFIKAQQGSLDRLETTTNAITTKAHEVSDNVEQSMNKIKDTAQESYDNFSQTQTELLDKTKKDILKFAKTLETESTGISQKLSDLVVKVTKTISDNVDELHNRQDALCTQINGTLKGITSSVEDMSRSTDRKLDQTMTMLQKTTQTTVDSIQSKTDSSLEQFLKAQKESLGKVERSTSQATDTLVKTQEKIDNSIATFQKRTEETVNYLQDKTASSINKLEEAVNSIAATAIDDKEITEQKKVALGEFNDQTRNLKTCVEEMNKYEREIVNRTTDTTDVLKATAVTLRDKLFETSVNFYITWCILVVVLVFSRSQQGTGGNMHGAAPPPVNNTTGNNRQDTKRVQPAATSRDRQLNIPTGPPKYDITVVTFSSECLAKAPELFSKAMSGKTVQYRVLTGSLDLSDVPSSRGYVVLIGTDARNTILEDMDGSAGSRKRETITALQKTQGDVLVIYLDNNYHDVENPPEGVLVNPHLQRTSSHPILRALVTRQRLITLRREAWNSAQTEHLIRWTRRLR